MISLWTPNPRAAEKLRRLFRYSRFKISTPDSRETEDILSVIAPAPGQPDRMTLFGISLHLSEGLQPYINSLSGFSPAHWPSSALALSMNYDAAYAWLAKLPIGRRQIARPEFIKAHHGLICFGGAGLTDRLSLCLHKRLGKPAFIVNPMPFAGTYGLEYRFSPGSQNLSRLLEKSTKPAEADRPHSEPAHRVSLILNTEEIDSLRARSGSAYLYKLRDFLSSLSVHNISELDLVWQSNQSAVNQRRREDFHQFISRSAQGLQINWTTQLKDTAQNSSSAIFALSAFAGEPIAQKTSRLIYALQGGPFNGLGGPKLWDERSSAITVSGPLTPEQKSRHKKSLSWVGSHYSFDNAITSRKRFKSVIQEVVLNGVPKI